MYMCVYYVHVHMQLYHVIHFVQREMLKGKGPCKRIQKKNFRAATMFSTMLVTMVAPTTTYLIGVATPFYIYIYLFIIYVYVYIYHIDTHINQMYSNSDVVFLVTVHALNTPSGYKTTRK